MPGLANMAMMTNPAAVELRCKVKTNGTMNTTKPSVTKLADTKPVGSQRPTAPHPKPGNRGATMLKSTLVVGSMVATLLGANLAARQEQANAGEPRLATAESSAPLFNTSRSLATLPNLQANSKLGRAEVDALLNMPLAPMPSLSIPAPMTRSRSSR